MIYRFNLRPFSRSTWMAIAVFSLLLGSCSSPQAPDQAENSQPTNQVSAIDDASKPLIYVTNYPLKYFVERIGEDEVKVELPIPADIDPAFWQPSADELSPLQTADLIILNGATYEKWLQTASLPQSKLVDTAVGFRDRWLSIDSVVTHQHGPEGGHSHEGTAFTTWIDPTLAIAQAATIRDRLSAQLPAQADVFAANFKTLEQDLKAIDEQIARLVEESAQRDQPILASHPVYDYLAKRYGLNLKSVLWEPESLPEDTQWSQLAEILAAHPAKLMIWEGVPIPESVERLQQLGIESVVFDPVGNTPETGDFLTVMQANIDNLTQALLRPKISND